jgi:alpha-beta hydrolase superfamily lysophospholipase
VVFDRQFTEEAVVLPCNSRCTRQDFEWNALADATKDISGTHTPVLILMGKDDRNVDSDETAAARAKHYRWALPLHQAVAGGHSRAFKK